ncbi:UNVERIFIED_CONTAM: hypothetical protein RKD50_009369 [Streptomyces canus]
MCEGGNAEPVRGGDTGQGQSAQGGVDGDGAEGRPVTPPELLATGYCVVAGARSASVAASGTG